MLKFNIIVTFYNPKRLCGIKASLPIIIISNRDTTLPAYNENCLDEAYFEDDDSNQCSATSSLFNFSFSTRSSKHSHEIEELIELSKLPSYRSIASHIPAPLADSILPPTYDDSVNDR